MSVTSHLRRLILTATSPLWIATIAAEPLDAYRGKSRLIVVYLSAESSVENLTRTLATQRGKIEERDLIIIDASEGRARIQTAQRPPPDQVKAIRQQLGLSPAENQSTFILIGKDGGEKARCQDDLDLEKWFKLIDSMPMRQAEIQDRKTRK